jgi:PKD repeat protein
VAPTATLVSNGQSGPAPYDLSFTIDGFDENGDALTWEFLPEGAGGPSFTGTEADFPAMVSHTYATAGNYTATLTVSDGSLQGSASVDIVIT